MIAKIMQVGCPSSLPKAKPVSVMDLDVSQDILREIPDDDLVTLRNLYKKHRLEMPHIYNLLEICIKWKKRKGHSDNIIFLGIDDDWLKTGTFIILMEYSCRDIFLSTLDEDYKKIHEALTETRKIDWTKKTIWFSIASKHVPLLTQIIREIRPPNCNFLGSSLWAMDTDKALQLEIECPDHVYITELDKSHAFVINYYWKYKLEGTEGYLAQHLEMSVSCGLFLKSDDRLVCWALVNHLGIISNLYTLPEYTRNGYALLVIKFLSKRMAEDGLIPVSCIMTNNTPSEHLFTKVGFRMYDRSMFVW